MRVKHPDSHLTMSQSYAIYSVIFSYPRVSPLFGQQSVLMLLNLDMSLCLLSFAGLNLPRGQTKGDEDPAPLLEILVPWLTYEEGWSGTNRLEAAAPSLDSSHLHPASTPLPDGSTHQSLDSPPPTLPPCQSAQISAQPCSLSPFTSPVLPRWDR